MCNQTYNGNNSPKEVNFFSPLNLFPLEANDDRSRAKVLATYAERRPKSRSKVMGTRTYRSLCPHRTRTRVLREFERAGYNPTDIIAAFRGGVADMPPFRWPRENETHFVEGPTSLPLEGVEMNRTH